MFPPLRQKAEWGVSNTSDIFDVPDVGKIGNLSSVLSGSRLTNIARSSDSCATLGFRDVTTVFDDHSSEQVAAHARRHSVSYLSARPVSETLEDQLQVGALNNQLRHLRDLNCGWDDFDAQPPSHASIDAAKLIVGICTKLMILPLAVVPSAEGGVGIVFRNRNRFVSIELQNDNSLVALLEEGNSHYESWESEFTSEIATNTLLRVRRFLGINS
jgi:hypothetical protein